MHFIYNDPVQCRLHGSIQCGSKKLTPISAGSQTHEWAQIHGVHGTHLVPCDYTKHNQTNHCRSVLALTSSPSIWTLLIQEQWCIVSIYRE